MTDSTPKEQPDYMRLLPPEAISAVSRLEFLARHPKMGSISGRHRSPHKGFSSEFAEHRQYVRGDDLRLLDWRVYARSDDYYIKEFTEETNLRATLLVDASASMAYAGEHAHRIEGRPQSKLDFARRLAAMLTYLFIHQQDATAIVTYDNAVRKYLPARGQPRQMRRILEHLNELDAGGESDMAPILNEIAERIPKRGLVVIISDLFDDPAELVKALHHLRFRHHELVVFHVMAEEEISFPLSGFADFNDLEGTFDSLAIDPGSLRAQYIEQVNGFIDQIEQDCGRMEAVYMPVNTRHSAEDVITRFMLSRQRSR